MAKKSKLFSLNYWINSKTKHNRYFVLDYRRPIGRKSRLNVRSPLISHPDKYSLLIASTDTTTCNDLTKLRFIRYFRS